MAVWTEQSKSTPTWTAQSKSQTARTLQQGSPIGLLLTLTYATTTVESGTTWTNQTKN